MTDNRRNMRSFVSCPKCGYDLQGLDQPPRCPECGVLWDLQRVSEYWQRRNKELTIATLLAVGLGVAGGVGSVVIFGLAWGGGAPAIVGLIIHSFVLPFLGAFFASMYLPRYAKVFALPYAAVPALGTLTCLMSPESLGIWLAMTLVIAAMGIAGSWCGWSMGRSRKGLHDPERGGARASGEDGCPETFHACPKCACENRADATYCIECGLNLSASRVEREARDVDAPSPDQPAEPLAMPSNPAHGDRLTNSIGMGLMYIEPGTFMMGSPEEGVSIGGREMEHRVTLTKGFYMGVTAVTQAQWRAVMRSNPSHCQGDALPVERISWREAVMFCELLGQREGVTYRLPTEAEWEYACRAGTTTAYCFGEGSEWLGRCAWYAWNSGHESHAVASKQPNAWGLHDMHGNVWEWCQDWYDPDYYRRSPAEDPVNTEARTFRVLRGGGWFNWPGACRSASRSGGMPDYLSVLNGLRVCLDV
ncbi:MAG: formylglycine-generating enzyme family protein [Phycisphaerales bacterium]|nr:formylglycine-generating enzyme family protein [Phycisphaerales bacterium]